MAAIINALFGTYPDSEQQNTTETVAQHSATSSECLHTSVASDDVQIKSVISSETQANASINMKLNTEALLTKLNAAYAHIDEYSHSRTAEINEQVKKSIIGVLENTQHQQEELLTNANRRHLVIDNEYKIQLQKAIEALDAVKAKSLADLERDLQAKQQSIMDDAKKQIDLVNDQANLAKLNVLVEAQEQAKQNIDNLTNQVAITGQHETENILQSTTTTVITSQAHATETVVTTPVTPIADNQLQVAIRSPGELVLLPTATNTTTVDVVPIASDVTKTAVEAPVTSISADVTSNSSSTVETEVKTS
ncbi:unnamed protein product [Adineta steineri]|uniref:Uncharacterized protein n=1 Tax=Adineta steineri TaxID=433720 RepID=A0A818V4N5_9BILA|nr:unnamed protein product [Adineta steineri]